MENLEKAMLKIRFAVEKGAHIICLQELFRSRYFCQKEDTEFFNLAESIPGESTSALGSLAKELGVVVIAPLFEKRANGIYHNTATIIDADGSLAGKYRKMHIPDDPCFYEKFYFTPGDTGFKPIETAYGKVGVLICWDQWFPEAARLCALAGAQIIFYPTAIGYQQYDVNIAEKQYSAWQMVQRSHAIANGVFVAAVNRVGQESHIHFWGRSFVCDPFGALIANLEETEEVLTAVCNLNLIEEIRRSWPFLRDRRTDSYGDLSKLYLDD